MHLSCDLRPFKKMVTHPLNFLIEPKAPTPEALEALKELTLFNLERKPDAATLIHNAWANGLKEVTLNGVECSITVVQES